MDCYIYDEKIYNSRIPLLGKSNVRLWFHDTEFSKVDWTIEPSESIDELYRQRAQSLREKYDYLILMYSGGADSQQVLRSFIDNNIMLDEIHTFFPLKMFRAIENGEYPNGYNLSLLKEFDEAVIPRLNRVGISHPQIKVKVWDMTPYIHDHHLSDNFLQDNQQLFGVHNKFHAIKTACQMLGIRDYIDTFPCKVGVIYASDKPNFRYVDNILHFYFTDLGRSSPGSYDIKVLNYDPVLFYWDPEAWKILVKQSHLFKRLVDKLPGTRYIHRDSHLMKKLLYPSTFESSIFQQPIKDKHHDEEILMFFYGRKEAENIESLNPLRFTATSKLYKVG